MLQTAPELSFCKSFAVGLLALAVLGLDERCGGGFAAGDDAVGCQHESVTEEGPCGETHVVLHALGQRHVSLSLLIWTAAPKRK